MKFGDLRQMIDRTARIQICDHVSGDYMDYRFVEDVPHEYDSRTVFGIGLVRSEYREEGVFSYGRNCYAIEIRLLKPETILSSKVLEYEANHLYRRLKRMANWQERCLLWLRAL